VHHSFIELLASCRSVRSIQQSGVAERAMNKTPGLSAPMCALWVLFCSIFARVGESAQPIKYLKYLRILVGAPRFELGTPSPPDCHEPLILLGVM
jgi:hypothetical protein